MTMFQFASAPSLQNPGAFFFGAVDSSGVLAANIYQIQGGGGADFRVAGTAGAPTIPASGGFVAQRGGNITRLSVQQTAAGAGAINLTYTVYVNGVATGLSVVLASNAIAPAFANAAAVIAVLPGDRIDLILSAAADEVGPPNGIYAAVDFA